MTLDELREYAGFGNDKSDVFDSWNAEKRRLNALTKFPHSKRRQVWWCNIGQNIGHEQSCSVGFQRPVLVVAAFGNIFWGLPITSSDSAGKKSKDPLYIQLDETSYIDENGLEKVLHGFIALRQLRAFDSRRLIRKIARLDVDTFDGIVKRVRDLI